MESVAVSLMRCNLRGEGWRKVLIIPASRGKVKLLSGFVCGLAIGAIFLRVTNPFGSAL